MRKKTKCFFVFSILVLASCKTLNPNLSFSELLESRSETAKKLENKSSDTNCKLNSKRVYDAFELNNNLWGESRLKCQEAHLCTYYSEDGFGWKWDVPYNARGVIGYPNIKMGPGPWRSSKEKVHGFPIKIEEITELKVTYDTEIYVKHKKYNLAFDLWLSSEFQSNQNTITTEIMIWEDFFDFRSYGKKVDEITTDFGVYEVMSGYLKNEEFNQDWQYFAFVRKEKRNNGELDVKYLLDYLVKHQKVNPQEFITSVEFGNEIGNSSGFTLIKNYELTLN